ENQVVVVGAGTAGLAAALCLSDLSIPSVVLERGDGVGAAWRSRYDGLRLNTAVERVVRRKPSGWGVLTPDGIVGAAHVVVATGYLHTPVLPDWPGWA